MSPRHTPRTAGAPRYRTPRRYRGRLLTLAAGVTLVVASALYLAPAGSYGADAAPAPTVVPTVVPAVADPPPVW